MKKKNAGREEKRGKTREFGRQLKIDLTYKLVKQLDLELKPPLM